MAILLPAEILAETSSCQLATNGNHVEVSGQDPYKATSSSRIVLPLQVFRNLVRAFKAHNQHHGWGEVMLSLRGFNLEIEPHSRDVILSVQGVPQEGVSISFTTWLYFLSSWERFELDQRADGNRKLELQRAQQLEAILRRIADQLERLAEAAEDGTASRGEGTRVEIVGPLVDMSYHQPLEWVDRETGEVRGRPWPASPWARGSSWHPGHDPEPEGDDLELVTAWGLMRSSDGTWSRQTDPVGWVADVAGWERTFTLRVLGELWAFRSELRIPDPNDPGE